MGSERSQARRLVFEFELRIRESCGHAQAARQPQVNQPGGGQAGTGEARVASHEEKEARQER